MMAPLTRVAIPAVFLCVLSGCALFPRALHPSQLWKMNRQEPWDEGSFSVPDPVDVRLTGATGDGPDLAVPGPVAPMRTAADSAD